VEFDNGAIGVIHASRWASGYANTLRLRVFGDQGAIELQHGFDGTTLRACVDADVNTQTWTDVTVEPVGTNYQAFVVAVLTGKTAEPSFRRAANLQQVIDAGFMTEVDRREADVSSV
jgi:predicted dehydrogenase